METSLKAMRKLTRESDHIVLISGLGVARAAGLNGVRAEHIAYDIEQKYGYSNDEIISSMFLSKRVEIFYQYYKEIILNCCIATRLRYTKVLCVFSRQESLMRS